MLYGLTGNIFLTTEQYFILDSCVKSNAQCSKWQELCVCHCNFDYVMVSGNCVKGMIFYFNFFMWCTQVENSSIFIPFDAYLQRTIILLKCFGTHFTECLIMKKASLRNGILSVLQCITIIGGQRQVKSAFKFTSGIHTYFIILTLRFLMSSFTFWKMRPLFL